MNYWLCLTDEINFEIIERENVWGVSDRHKKKIEQVQKGDKLVFYQIKNPIKRHSFPCIRGYGRVAGRIFRDESKLFGLSGSWKFGEVFPNRVKLLSVKDANKIFHFKEIMPKINFIKNKQYWSLHLLGQAMIKLDKDDYLTIIEAIE